jgi:ribonuclease BN (tRNA processing enzyme)
MVKLEDFMARMKADHSPVEDVGRIAQDAEVKALVLSHLIPACPPQKCPHRSMNLEAGHGGDSNFTISEGHLREPSRIRSASCSVQSPTCIVGAQYVEAE